MNGVGFVTYVLELLKLSLGEILTSLNLILWARVCFIGLRGRAFDQFDEILHLSLIKV